MLIGIKGTKMKKQILVFIQHLWERLFLIQMQTTIIKMTTLRTANKIHQNQILHLSPRLCILLSHKLEHQAKHSQMTQQIPMKKTHLIRIFCHSNSAGQQIQPRLRTINDFLCVPQTCSALLLDLFLQIFRHMHRIVDHRAH